jgi:class 3 adenylate cyclase/CHASE2 domain-containing sensor protein
VVCIKDFSLRPGEPIKGYSDIIKWKLFAMEKINQYLSASKNYIFSNKLKLFFYSICLMAVFLLLAVFYLFKINHFIDSIELYLYDYRTRIYVMTQGKEPDPDVVLLLHNDYSDSLLEQNKEALEMPKWPFPRKYWGDVLKYMRRAPSNLCVFDIKFSSDDKDEIQTIISLLKTDVNLDNQQAYEDSLYPLFKNEEEIRKAKLQSFNDMYFFNELINNNKDFFANTLLAFISQAQLATLTSDDNLNYIKSLGLDTKENFLKKVLLFDQHATEADYNVYTKKFIKVPWEHYEKLKFEMLKYLIVLHYQGIHEPFVSVNRAIGTINVENTTDITEVTRDYKTFYIFSRTGLIIPSLPFATAREALNHPGINFKSDKFGLGTTLEFGDRKFKLNDKGNTFINWRKKLKPDGSLYGTHRFEILPLTKAFIYEKFETLDKETGFYITPEEDNFSWQSIFNYLYNHSVAEFYTSYLLQNSRYHGVGTLQDRVNGSYMEHLERIIRAPSLSSHHSAPDGFFFYNPKVNDIPLIELFGYFPNNDDRNRRDWKEVTSNLDESIYPYFLSYFYSYGRDITENDLDRYKFSADISDYLENKTSGDYMHPYHFTNKFVILGEATATGDIHHTPVAKAYPGPEIVATAIDNYLNDGTPDRRFITAAPFWVDLVITIVFVIFVVYATLKSSTYIGSGVILSTTVIVFILLNLLLFSLPSIRLWVNFIYPMTAIVLTSVLTIAYKNMIIDKDKKQIKSLFGKFVSPQILDAVIDNPDFIQTFKPRKKEMTVLFSDIRDFTTRSEVMQPLELIEQLNEYLTEMVEVIIMKYNGTLDKYMGDAVMAFWGDPIPMEDHAQRAVLTALLMREHLKLMNKKWAKEGKTTLRIGIGINTGEMIAGHMGSPRLVDYTVLGDSVNTASRLEGLNKQYGTEIIISGTTYELVKDIIDAEFLGTPSIKGKTQEVKAYNVIGLKEDADINFDRHFQLITQEMPEDEPDEQPIESANVNEKFIYTSDHEDSEELQDREV